MSRKYPKILRNRKARITRRLKPRSWPSQPEPMFTGSNIHFEMADKVQALGSDLAKSAGLVKKQPQF